MTDIKAEPGRMKPVQKTSGNFDDVADQSPLPPMRGWVGSIPSSNSVAIGKELTSRTTQLRAESDACDPSRPACCRIPSRAKNPGADATGLAWTLL